MKTTWVRVTVFFARSAALSVLDRIGKLSLPSYWNSQTI